MQRLVRGTAVFEGRIEADVVVGVDQGFVDGRVISAAIVMQNGDVVTESSAVEPTPSPYVPGLLSFREGPAVVSALSSLDVDPDVVFVDGSGRIHYREAGLATHIGVVFDTPTVGVAKNLLCGRVDDEGLEEGDARPVRADASVEQCDDGAVIGAAFQSRQYASDRRHVNPLYVSPGHLAGVDGAVKAVRQWCDTYKLPVPIREAEAAVNDAKQAL